MAAACHSRAATTSCHKFKLISAMLVHKLNFEWQSALPGGCRAPSVTQARPEGPAACAPVVNASVRTTVCYSHTFPLTSLSQHVQGAHRSQVRVHMYRRTVTAERSWPMVSFSFLGKCGHSHCLVRAGSRSPEWAPNPPLPLPQPLWAACLHTAPFLSGQVAELFLGVDACREHIEGIAQRSWRQGQGTHRPE